MNEHLEERLKGLRKHASRHQWGGIDELVIKAKFSTANVTDPPTDAELDSAFGTPATLGAGFIGIVNDNKAGTDVWLCFTSQTEWFYLQFTKAV